MTGIRHARIVLLVAAALTVLAVPAAAAGSHGGGGGGGGGTTTTTAAPAVTLAPTSLTFGAQAIGTTSAPQSITVTNTGNAGLSSRARPYGTRSSSQRWATAAPV